MEQKHEAEGPPPERVRRPYRRYDEATKAALIARCLDGEEAIIAVAAELGVNEKTAWEWVNSERMRRLDPDGTLPPQLRQRLVSEQQKIARLERQNAELQRELDFAKKASAFFQQMRQRGTDTR
jgi:transposase-like protein